MQTSENGINLIKRSEGFSPAPINDNGHPCWGYGHDQIAGEEVPGSISRDEADLLLRRDLSSRYEPHVSSLVPSGCTQGQFDALVDFCYNLGAGALETMLGHGWEDVPNQIQRWNRVNGTQNSGLSARRAAEVNLFNS